LNIVDCLFTLYIPSFLYTNGFFQLAELIHDIIKNYGLFIKSGQQFNLKCVHPQVNSFTKIV